MPWHQRWQRTSRDDSFIALGLEVTHATSTSRLDRMTFRECGWYLPIFNLPFPLWLLGAGITVILLKPCNDGGFLTSAIEHGFMVVARNGMNLTPAGMPLGNPWCG